MTASLDRPSLNIVTWDVEHELAGEIGDRMRLAAEELEWTAAVRRISPSLNASQLAAGALAMPATVTVLIGHGSESGNVGPLTKEPDLKGEVTPNPPILATFGPSTVNTRALVLCVCYQGRYIDVWKSVAPGATITASGGVVGIGSGDDLVQAVIATLTPGTETTLPDGWETHPASAPRM